MSIVADDGPQEISIQAGQKLKLPCKVDNDERNRSVKFVNYYTILLTSCQDN